MSRKIRPEEIAMSDEVRRLVDERWGEYGLGDVPQGNGRRERSLSQLLRR